mgnify:FL=1
MATHLSDVLHVCYSIFLATMSHELRTPLTSLLGTGNLLALTHDMPQDAKELIDILRVSIVLISARQTIAASPVLQSTDLPVLPNND